MRDAKEQYVVGFYLGFYAIPSQNKIEISVAHARPIVLDVEYDDLPGMKA